ncbi:uncharacterized protein LOC114721169 [Neltuma alba]|uniref:uncharacterized protein LOC114721169 n=1 Tax=Neltuma alba TaxID=207710 RepID=UPI0010A50450|nr:uncharacterized protein LOC114721169 [Prosopis alba]
MAKRVLSSTLKNLKFMQRAALREEKSKKEEDEVKSDVNIFGTNSSCIVIMEGDPHPGAIKGWMSFQSFNRRINRLNEEDARLHRPAAETPSSRNQTGNIKNGDVKSKQSEVTSEAQNPTKLPKNDNGGNQSLPRNSLGYFKKPKGDKLDWNILRPPKYKRHNWMRILMVRLV